MSVKRSLMNKNTSFTALWDTIEDIYGEIPDLIKYVLQVNGFDSFLALRGIRYDDKHDFFSSLESTVLETVVSNSDSEEKVALEKLIGPNCTNFKLKPGHRNLIMNLMQEIDKIDVEEFFSKAQAKAPENDVDQPKSKVPKLSFSPQAIKMSPTLANEHCVYQIPDHVYSNDEHTREALESESEQQQEYSNVEDEEYVLEEYLEDQAGSFRFKVEERDSEAEGLETIAYELVNKKSSSKKRKPDRMYNDEFISQCFSPRNRRSALKKNYPDNDDGVRERFTDLVQQSMQCILSQAQLKEVEGIPIELNKESETSWSIICPLCQAVLKLAIVNENNGRYRNYKRSNFERHLRFKHCKEEKAIYYVSVN